MYMWGRETSRIPSIPSIHQSQSVITSRGIPNKGIIHGVTAESPALQVGSNCRRQNDQRVLLGSEWSSLEKPRFFLTHLKEIQILKQTAFVLF